MASNDAARVARSPSPMTQEPQSEADDPLLGVTLGSFRIMKRIGRGGMGAVYLGEQTVIGSKVAIKVLHDHLASNPSLVSRFYAEARAVNVIGHENIVSIFDMNVAPPSRYFLVMEYLEGRPLQALTKGPVEPSVGIPIMSQVCDALQAAHAHGVIHRDLKPENIFLTSRGRMENFVKVLDFGIAKLFAAEYSGEQTSAGIIIGTPEYMAPEQANGERPDGRADIYSLGIIGYLLATGRLPFTGGGVTGLLLAHREKIPPAPIEVNPSVPRAWSEAIMRAIAKRPADRFQDAAAFRDALEAALANATMEAASSVNAAVPAPATQTPKPTLKLTATPAPVDSRHAAAFDADWIQPTGQVQLPCVDVSRGGLFLCLDGPLPPVFARVNLVLKLSEGPCPCVAEVVRHVTPEQAKAWNMSPGFGVQFVDTDAAFKETIARFVQGLPRVKPVKTVAVAEDDATAEPQLAHYRKRINGDHYVVLALMQDAEFNEVRHRAREAEKDLEALKAKLLSKQQLEQVATALEKIRQSVDVLGNVPKRVRYDANKGNFRGVARCIAAGLTVTELDQLRIEHVASHPGTEARAQIHLATATSWESRGQVAMALDEFEQSLTADPLNLVLHQRYWALKRRNQAAPPRS